MKYLKKEFLHQKITIEGMSCNALAKQCNVSEFTIRRYAKSYGIDTSRKIKEKIPSRVITSISDENMFRFVELRKKLNSTNDKLMTILLKEVK
jgi:transposase